MKPRDTDDGRLPLVVDLKQASAITGLNVWMLRRLTFDGTLPVVRLPRPGGRGQLARRILLRVEDLRRLIDQHVERLSG